MILRDRVYGQFRVDEPLVIDLVKSPALQRLKGIDQSGYFEPFFPGTRHSRFEHSVGVYYLLRRFNAPLVEQVAGLLHDVSHTVFSHCIDYALAQGSETRQDYQDNTFKEFVLSTDIARIVSKYGLSIKYILDESNFPLLETRIPDICADRLDYSLRTGVMFGEITPKRALGFLNDLIVRKNVWVFTAQKSAVKYARFFHMLNTKYYAGLSSAVMFRSVGDTLRTGLIKGYLNQKDLYKSDAHVLSKIKRACTRDSEILLLFARMNGQVGYREDRKNYNAKVSVKSRIVDPYCMWRGRIARVSEIHPEWKKTVKKELKPKKYFIRFAE